METKHICHVCGAGSSVNTQNIKSANLFGEILREYCFDCPEDEYGCYSCFEVKPEFHKVGANSEIGKMIVSAIVRDSTYKVFINAVIKHGEFYSNGTIHFGWYWDGDGTLAFIEGDRCVVNSDCKNDYEWDWVHLGVRNGK